VLGIPDFPFGALMYLNHICSTHVSVFANGNARPNRPRHYIINGGLRPAEATYWSDRRVTAIGISFEELLKELDDNVAPGKRELGFLAKVLKSSYGFIQCSEPKLDAYFDMAAASDADEEFSEGTPVIFELGFNLRGPVAIRISTV
jgi:cold shock CspA family protein